MFKNKRKLKKDRNYKKGTLFKFIIISVYSQVFLNQYHISGMELFFFLIQWNKYFSRLINGISKQILTKNAATYEITICDM
jgi:hypothetical protein